MPFRRVCAIAVVVLLGLVPARPQGQQPAPEARFSSRSELVLVPTIVTDGSGAHIPNLAKDGFHLYEDGVEQKIAVFEEINTSRDLPKPLTASLTEFTNRPGGSTVQRRLTILALDQINTPQEAQANARQQLFQYLSELLTNQELFSVVLIRRGGVHMIHDFTEDPKTLLAALNKLKNMPQTLAAAPSANTSIEEAKADGLSSADPMDAAEAQLETLWRDYQRNDRAFLQEDAALLTTEYLRLIARKYAAVPGRKSLIWLTAAFPFSISDPLRGNSANIGASGRSSLVDVQGAYDRLSRDFNQAQMALYPVDVRGLFGAGVPDATQSVPVNGRVRSMAALHNFSYDTHFDIAESQGTMRTFADMTGGRAYINTNDLKRALTDAVHDSESYYLLGYYMHQPKRPGWHKLSVRVGQPRAEVRARNGFYVARATESTSVFRNEQLNAAVTSPLDYTEIAVTASWEPSAAPESSGDRRVRFKLALPPGFAIIDDADSNHMIFEVVALARTSDGRLVAAPFSESLESHLKPENAEQVRREGLTYRNSLELPPGNYTVKFVVRDGLSGRMGSVAAPLDILP